MTDIAQLIERLEKATGASQELNADIWLATRVKWSNRQFWHWRGAQPKGDDPTEREYALDRAPNFTGSIDAAMPLIQEGWYVQSITQCYDGWDCCLHLRTGNPEEDHELWKVGHHWPRDRMVSAHIEPLAALPPIPSLAVCIAAMRARARAQTKGE